MLNHNEIKVINKVAQAAKWAEFKVTRRSDRQYDLEVMGVYASDSHMPNVAFSAWLPLVAIRELTEWTRDPVAGYTNYPDMCRSGDWSGLRDSDPERIWEIFIRFAS